MPVEVQRGGLVVRGAPLWLDARQRAPQVFVSHAHSDHIARHDRVIATPETLALMAHRLGPQEDELPLPYGSSVDLEGFRVEVFPAGHVLGAAQVRVTRPDGHRIGFSGDLSLAPSMTARQAEVVACETLVLEATFGHPRFRFPPQHEVYDRVGEWVRQQQVRGVQPVLLAYSLGKAQEAARQLAARGFSVSAHSSIAAVSRVYERLGVPVGVREFDGAFAPGEVGLFPPHRHRALLAGLGPFASAVLSGWALEPWGARRAGADVAFPASDHADFPTLVEYARATGAREVITVHGFVEELAAGLRAAGMFARAVSRAVQMDLPLAL